MHNTTGYQHVPVTAHHADTLRYTHCCPRNVPRGKRVISSTRNAPYQECHAAYSHISMTTFVPPRNEKSPVRVRPEHVPSNKQCNTVAAHAASSALVPHLNDHVRHPEAVRQLPQHGLPNLRYG